MLDARRAQLWKVVSGDARGGLLVKKGLSLASEKASQRLGGGAILEELELSGERLHFRKLFGTGPAEGWITISLNFKALAERVAGQDVPIVKGLLALEEAHRQRPVCERRLHSWSAALSLSIAWLQLAGRLRRGTAPRPLLLWVLGAAEKEEGSLASGGHFQDLNLVDGAVCEMVLVGSGQPTEADAGRKHPRFRFVDANGLRSCKEPDLLVVFMPKPGETAEGLLPLPGLAKMLSSRPCLVTTRTSCCPEDLSSLAEALEGQSDFLLRRNVLSALGSDPTIVHDDNGWLSCVDGASGLSVFLNFPKKPPEPELSGTGFKLPVLFWGIMDLKYDADRPPQDRVRLLELGDGKSSKFSGDGAFIPDLVKERYNLEDPAVTGLRSLIPANKKLTHDLLHRCGCGHLLPRQVCFPRVYSPGLASSIVSALGCCPGELVVLKLLNRSRGAGVLPVTVEQLDEVLRAVLLLPEDLEEWFQEQLSCGSSLPLLDLEWGCFEEHRRNWWSNECPYFLAEQFCSSTPTELPDGRFFDGTLRIAFALRRLDGKRMPKDQPLDDLGDLTLDWLGGYWKLPKGDLAEEDARERLVSAARVSGTAPVQLGHLQEVYAAVGNAVQLLFAGPPPSADMMRALYSRELPLASYLISRLSVSLPAVKSSRAYLQEAEDLLGGDAGPASLCASSYASRCLGVLEAMTGGGCWASAKRRFERSRECMPSNSTSLYLLGMAALELGSPEKAVVWMCKSLILDPDFKAPYANLGAAYLRVKQFGNAIAISEAALRRHPDTPHCLYHLGTALFYQAATGGPDAEGRVPQLREEALRHLQACRASEDWQARPKRDSDDAIFEALLKYREGRGLPSLEPSSDEGWCFVGRVGRRWQPG